MIKKAQFKYIGLAGSMEPMVLLLCDNLLFEDIPQDLFSMFKIKKKHQYNSSSLLMRLLSVDVYDQTNVYDIKINSLKTTTHGDIMVLNEILNNIMVNINDETTTN